MKFEKALKLMRKGEVVVTKDEYATKIRMFNQEIETSSDGKNWYRDAGHIDEFINMDYELYQPQEEVKKGRWKPKEDDRYYFVDSCGDIGEYTWYGNYEDDYRYNFRNCFQTQQEAEFEVERRIVEAELKNFAEENNEGVIDWDSSSDKYYIKFASVEKRIRVFKIVSIRGIDTYFTSEELANQAIETIGADRIKKYYFGVEE